MLCEKNKRAGKRETPRYVCKSSTVVYYFSVLQVSGQRISGRTWQSIKTLISNLQSRQKHEIIKSQLGKLRVKL